MAALLHDIGHLPFSHSGEEATAKFSEKRDMDQDIEADENENPNEELNWWRPTKVKLHEKLSRLVVERWGDLIKIFEKYNIDYEEVGRIITGSSDLYKTLLLHSELDADRLDYLLRDSSFLGVSYGNIELDHIISMINCGLVGGDPIIGVSSKGIHAVEHYILARYFMYSQIVFYPKIWFLEFLLKEIYTYMIECSDPDFHVFSEDELIDIICNNKYHDFYDFNDHLLYYKMRLLHDKLQKTVNDISSKEFIINEHIKLILSGQIPEPLLLGKTLINESDNHKVKAFEKEVKQKLITLCNDFGIPLHALAFGFPSTKPTKIQGRYPTGEALPDDAEEAIKIIYPDGSIKLFIHDHSTVLLHLAEMRLQCFYVFGNPLILNKLEINVDKLKDSLKKVINMELIF